jgi:serine/threonine-protein kinase PRP4
MAPKEDPHLRRGAWREELEEKDGDDDDEVDSDGIERMETDEDVERKLAESRARREALIAKWVNRGEEPGLQFADTNTSLHDEEEGEESDGEVAAFFAARQKQLSDGAAVDNDALEKKKAVNRFILQHRGEHDGDMFDEDADAKDALNRTVDQAGAIATTGASADDWNDAEGYYKAKIGEVMAERYLVTEDKCGQGVFSNVVKAKDQHKQNELVAIKIMRCNDMMRAAAEKEIEVLERLNAADKANKRNVIRLLRYFTYRGHLCLVFECMWDNLRVALKKYTKDKGMSLRAVRAYTKQLLVALQHIHRCGVIHADIKPDNILISAGHNITKICDLGSAVELTEIEPTPYLVSRFYRAPEIVLGAKYGPQSDTFALGATLCEIFTGKILFPGRSNNDMLRHFMELKGKPPKQFIKSGMTWKQHFDENLDFQFVDSDKVTRKKKVRTITDCSAKRSIADLIMARVGPEKQKSSDAEDQLYVKKAKQFADLINQMTMLDPEKRATPEDLLKHPFVVETMPNPKAGAKDGNGKGKGDGR